MRLFDDQALPRLTAGVDEVGRGPLAGPVYAAAVILDPCRPVAGLRDSKALNAQTRAALAQDIRAYALCWSLGRAEVAEIDTLNILRASHLAMQRAVAALLHAPQLVFVDGHLSPAFGVATVALVKGDALMPAISAASIIAKVARDAEMVALAERYPGYGLERHKGYATREHLEALDRLGPTPLHRRSFAPVREAFGRPPGEPARDELAL